MLEARNAALRAIGFSSFAEYSKSQLWKVIRREILLRDAKCCRMRGCRNKADGISFLSYRQETLLGESPASLLSTCKDCRRRIALDGEERRSMNDALKTTISMVVGQSLTPGRSNPKIGRWFADNVQMNKPVAAKIKKRISSLTAN